MTVRRLVVSPRAETRQAVAERWLAGHSRTRDLLVVAPGDAGRELLRAFAAKHGATLGWRSATPGRLAATLAAPAMAERGWVAASPLVVEALAMRVVQSLAQRGALGRFSAVGRAPGLPRALARTAQELRMAGVTADEISAVDPDLAVLLAALADEIAAANVADRSAVFALARDAASEAMPTLLLDVRVEGAVDNAFYAALADRSPDVLATVPEGDEASLARLSEALRVAPERLSINATGALARAQTSLFGEAETERDGGDDVTILSAPGESRECVELARVILREAERGVPFDRIAILLRAPEAYRSHLVEALRRARIPAYFAAGARLPDPSGRALLALLACAAEGCSARRFAEYLSLGEVPAGEPRVPRPEDRLPASEDELSPASLDAPAEHDERDDAALPVAPRRWERLIVDASVVGGRDRWARRLSHHRAALAQGRARRDAEEPSRVAAVERDLAALAALESFALPVIDALTSLPEGGTWGAWLAALSGLASRALRRPERVLAVLAELAPMASIGPVGLAAVRLALSPRLVDVPVAPPTRRYGRVYVADATLARGLSFEVVLVPGVVERSFPRKLAEDPLLSDAARAKVSRGLARRGERVVEERLALRLAVGAARRRLAISWPRVDAADGRPRTPSFYALEVVRAAEGRLPGFDELSRRAERAGALRLGWPAPVDKQVAIDDAEHDLALLAEVLARPEDETRGAARYLVTANAHLARSLRARHARWKTSWTSADGLCRPGAVGRASLAALSPASYAPTTLETFAACPFRFYLRAVVRLAPREESVAWAEVDARQRGLLFHAVLHALSLRLARESLFPLRDETLAPALIALDEELARVAAEHAEILAPSIARTWEEATDAIRADLREWLRRRASASEPATPFAFELGFDHAVTGLPIALRGAIDAVERRADGGLVAVDYKTGRVRARADSVIGGGQVLQPVLYALALEAAFPSDRVAGARLSYCTTKGGFTEVELALDPVARGAAKLALDTIVKALESGMFPAAPIEDACSACDYAAACGPSPEARAERKPSLTSLALLRSQP